MFLCIYLANMTATAKFHLIGKSREVDGYELDNGKFIFHLLQTLKDHVDVLIWTAQFTIDDAFANLWS